MVIVVVYQIEENDPDFPVLLHKNAESIEYWVREGSLNLGSVYDNLPSSEVYLEHPVSVTVVK